MRLNGIVSFNNAATLKTKCIASPKKCYIMNVNTKYAKGLEAAFRYSQSVKRGSFVQIFMHDAEAS
jgi:hypothetical protein